MTCNEGPCLEAVTLRSNYLAKDLRADQRWPVWGPRASELGWSSMMSARLIAPDHTFGALNLYSHRLSFFDETDFEVAERFAELASLSLTRASERKQLMEAVASRHFIGQAQGILMERYGIDAETAFQVLRRYSACDKRKLRDVAEELATGRAAPEP